jgi:hypothetical protein
MASRLAAAIGIPHHHSLNLGLVPKLKATGAGATAAFSIPVLGVISEVTATAATSYTGSAKP